MFFGHYSPKQLLSLIVNSREKCCLLPYDIFVRKQKGAKGFGKCACLRNKLFRTLEGVNVKHLAVAVSVFLG